MFYSLDVEDRFALREEGLAVTLQQETWEVGEHSQPPESNVRYVTQIFCSFKPKF